MLIKKRYKNILNTVCVYVSIICIATGFIIVSSVHIDTLNSNKVKEDSLNVVESNSDSEIVPLLQKLFNNEEIVGYLYFPEASISYPIVQSKDNEKYLKKDVYGIYSSSGSIFLDCENNSDFKDKMSILYGHHMRNGSMFGSLEDLDYINNEYYFTVYTENEKVLYKVTSSSVIQPEERLNYFNNSRVLAPEKAEVTLLTCHYLKSKTVRFGVTGEEVSREEYKDCKEVN